ncbi:MAG: chemotaxis protein CheC [Gammaproteobacteria bacterium]|jgi:chemotaxis protein CheC
MDMQSLTPDQTDTLQEIVNIAMGQAGDSLARVLDSFVQLSVPRIKLTEVANIGPGIADLVKNDMMITAVRQSFYDDLSGEAIIIFGAEGCHDLSDLMGYQNELDPLTEKEVLFDVSNILVGACLNGIAEQLNADLSFAAPSLIAENTSARALLAPDNLPWDYALQVEVNFKLEQRNFMSHLIIMMAEDAIGSLQRSLDAFLEAG